MPKAVLSAAVRPTRFWNPAKVVLSCAAARSPTSAAVAKEYTPGMITPSSITVPSGRILFSALLKCCGEGPGL